MCETENQIIEMGYNLWFQFNLFLIAQFIVDNGYDYFHRRWVNASKQRIDETEEKTQKKRI